MDSTQLALRRSAPRAVCQLGFCLLPEKQWKCAATLARVGLGRACGLGGEGELLVLQSFLLSACPRSRSALPPRSHSTSAPAPPLRLSCPSPVHVQPRENK